MPFIDTNVFVAALNRRDSSHRKGKPLLQKAFKVFDLLYTSDYILDECLSVAWARTKKIEFVKRINLVHKLDYFIQESEKIELLKVDESTFSSAKSYMRKFPRVIPTLTDWTCLVLMKNFGIESMLSFDEDFRRAKQTIDEFSHINLISAVSELKAFETS